MRENVLRDFYLYAADLLTSDKVQRMEEYIQHGKINCLQHCIGVAIFSLILVRVLNIKCNERSLVRGALLHDYFLYDWHKKEDWHRLHGFSHARTAHRNASRDFELNDIEQDIIKKHMWPLNLALPGCKEAWVVNLVDTYCSALETLGRFSGFHFLQEKITNAGV